MYKPDSLLENETHKILREKTRANVHPKEKKTLTFEWILLFRRKEKIYKYWDLARELTNTIEHAAGGDSNSKSCTWNSPQTLGKGIGRIGN